LIFGLEIFEQNRLNPNSFWWWNMKNQSRIASKLHLTLFKYHISQDVISGVNNITINIHVMKIYLKGAILINKFGLNMSECFFFEFMEIYGLSVTFKNFYFEILMRPISEASINIESTFLLDKTQFSQYW
jgi:hypothetical protein